MAEPFYADDSVTLWQGDALEVVSQLPDGSVDCVVTSPPYYGLRDYGVEGQYGLEESPAAYVETMRALFSEVRRVLADDGTLWLNIGDSYVSRGGAGGRMASNLGTAVLERPEARDPEKFGRWNKDWGLADKNLLGIPWRVAFALQDDGWVLRNDIIWAKQNGMPSSVKDRLSNRHEHVFLLSKSRRYWFDLEAIREEAVTAPDNPKLRWDRAGTEPLVPGHKDTQKRPNRHPIGGPRPEVYDNRNYSGNAYVPDGKRNPGDVWSLPTVPFTEAHFAVMPTALAERCVLAGCKPGGTVLDTFSGSGTTGLAAAKHGRKYVGIDLNREYLDLSLRTRLAQAALLDVEEPA